MIEFHGFVVKGQIFAHLLFKLLHNSSHSHVSVTAN